MNNAKVCGKYACDMHCDKISQSKVFHVHFSYYSLMLTAMPHHSGLFKHQGSLTQGRGSHNIKKLSLDSKKFLK